jgi:hypothetical protein
MFIYQLNKSGKAKATNFYLPLITPLSEREIHAMTDLNLSYLDPQKQLFKNCIICGQAFKRGNINTKQWTAQLCCSRSCARRNNAIHLKDKEVQLKIILSRTIENKNGCLEYTGYRMEKGYGKIQIFKRNEFVHRYIYSLLNGDITEGACVLHKCDNPPCINPEHLFLGTQKDNLIDMQKKGRRYRKVQTEDVAEIIKRFHSGIPQVIIANDFGISNQRVSQLICINRLG